VADVLRAEVAEKHASRRVIQRRAYGDWAGLVVLVVLAAMLAHNVLTNKRWQWSVIGHYMLNPLVLAGLGRTIELTLISAVTGTLFGVVIALLRLSNSRVCRALAFTYVAFMRAVPPLVLLLLLFFTAAIIPTVSAGVPFGPDFATTSVNVFLTQFTAAIVGLTMIVGAHTGEVFRGGILSVARGQKEAARALGMPPVTTFTRVVLPQAVRVSIPGLANELVSLFKNTSLVTIIGYTELLTVVQEIYGTTYQTVPMLLVAFFWYLLLTSIAMVGQAALERRFGRGFATAGTGR
jgi:polar amino acid transport system permease protein